MAHGDVERRVLPEVVDASRVEVLLGGRTFHLGEGPLWDTSANKLLMVDIEGKKVFRYDPEGDSLETLDAPSRVGTVVPIEGGGVAVALEDGFYRCEFGKEGFSRLAVDPEPDAPTSRFNDGKCDPQGRFWAGTMAIDPPRGAVGSLYSLSSDGTVKKHLDGITVSNGIVWTSDGKTMLYIDTPTMEVSAFDFDAESGTISNRRCAYRVPKEHGYPDGCTIDADDRVWIAHWSGSRVTCVEFDDGMKEGSGKVVCTIPLPATQITACAFSPSGDLYITSAKAELSESELEAQPRAGSLFRVKGLGVRMAPTHFFKAK